MVKVRVQKDSLLPRHLLFTFQLMQSMAVVSDGGAKVTTSLPICPIDPIEQDD